MISCIKPIKRIAIAAVIILFVAFSASAQIATYSACGGTCTTVSPGSPFVTVTPLTPVGFGSNTPCGSGGLSGLTANGYFVYSPANPHAYIKITPAAGYMINITSFTAGLRRSGSGITKVRFAYSLDNGATWTDDLTDHAPHNGSCGTTAVSAWGVGALPTGITSTTTGVMVALYPYSPISSGGVIQINSIVIGGTVTLACTAPTAYAMTGGGNYCAGGTGMPVGLSNTQTGVSYQLYNGASTVGSSFAGTGSAISFGTFTTAGTYTVLATGSTPGCTTAMTGSAVISIDPMPTPLSGTLTVCEGATTTLSSTPSGGTWSSSMTSTAAVSVASGVVTGVAAGTATIVYTTTAGCTTSDVVTVNLVPAAMSGTMSLCAGNSTTLITTSSGGTWSSSAVSVADIGSASGTVTTGMAGTATISYTYSTGCYTASIFTVYAMPATITGTTDFCEGTTTTLSNSVSGGTWSSSTLSVATVGSISGIVNGVAPGSANITYTMPGACTAITPVTVNPAPGTITGTTGVCQGQTITLANSVAPGTWSSSSPGTASITSSGVVSGINPGTTTIAYTTHTCAPATRVVTVHPLAPNVGLSNLCVSTSTIFSNPNAGGYWTSSDPTVANAGGISGLISGVSVGTSAISYSLPTGCVATTVVTVSAALPPITGASIVCQGLSTPLFNIVSGGAWSSSAPAVATIDAATGIVTGITAGSTTITYSIASGCYRTFVMTVGMAPSPIGGSSAVCEGSTITLTNTVAGGTWTSGSPAIAIIDPLTGVLTGISGGIATVSYDVVSCNPITYTVTVNPRPTPISGVTNVCVGATTSLSSSPSGGVWTSGSSLASVSPAGDVTGLAPGTSAMITYTLPTGCFRSVPVIVDSIPAPIAGPDSTCQGTSQTLTNTTPGGIWSSSNALTASIVATSGVITGHVPGTVTVSYTIITGCYRTKSFLVQTPIPASVAISTSPSLDSVVCAGTPVTFTASAVNGGDHYFQWQLFGENTDTGTTYTYNPTHGDFVTVYMIGSNICAAPLPAMDTLSINIWPTIAPVVNISTPSPNPTTYLGQVVTLYAEVSYAGSAVQYQWYQSGDPIPGATNNSYAAEIYQSDTFYCVVTGNPICSLSPMGISNKIFVDAEWLGVHSQAVGDMALALFPNPTNGTLSLKGSTGNSGELVIRVTDILGRQVFTSLAFATGGRIDTNIQLPGSLPPGSYLLSAASAGSIQTFHFVLSR